MHAHRLPRVAGLLLALTILAFFGLHTGDAFAAGGGIGDFLRVNMAPVMFATLVVFLLLGYPVAFALAANGLLFALIGIDLGLFQENFLQALPERIYGTMNNDVLLAVPFFTFMGLVLERSGMAEDLLDTIGQLFGPVRGGLAYAVIFVGALLAATTGVVAASVISMGLISLPIMLRYGYDRRLASGVIAASGTLAQIIPPSLVLIILADQLGRSVGDLYKGAFLPGFMLVGLYMLLVFIIAFYLLLGGVFGLSHVETSNWGGLMVTLILSFVGIAVSLPAGILLALGRRSKMPVIKTLCIIFIEVIRGVPLITVLFMASVMLPLFLPAGVNFDKFLRALVGVSIFAAAYMAEVIRGGLQAIPKGQYEGADSLGLGYWQKMRLIILPQAIKLVIPGIVNTFIGMFKDTSLVMIIGMFDLLGIINQSFADATWATAVTPVTGLIFAGFMYWLFCFGMSRYSAFMERHLDTGHKR